MANWTALALRFSKRLAAVHLKYYRLFVGLMLLLGSAVMWLGFVDGRPRSVVLGVACLAWSAALSDKELYSSLKLNPPSPRSQATRAAVLVAIVLSLAHSLWVFRA